MTSPWTDFLSRKGASVDDGEVRFSAEPQSGAAAMMVPLAHLGLIRSEGEESAAFLHNLLSSDVKKLAADAAQWSSFNTPKGRMLASLLVFSERAGHGLILSSDILPAIHKRLSMYVLRSKVAITNGANETALIGLAGSGAAEMLAAVGLPPPAADLGQSVTGGTRCIRLNAEMFMLVAAPEQAPALWDSLEHAGAGARGTDAWRLAMIRAGIPLVTAATQDEFVAQMLNFELIGGVSFSKGCYPGQEIVARTQYLGKLKKRMYRVHVPAGSAAKPGEDVFAPEFGEQSAGKLVNVAPSPEGGFEALAVMQSSSAALGEARVGAPDGAPLTFLPIPYALS